MSLVVSISSARSLVGNTIQGLAVWAAALMVSGLTQGTTTGFSATADGTATGTPLIGKNAALFLPPNYVPTDTAHQGGWSEAVVPSLDADGNLEFSLAIAATGPESFRIGLVYATYPH